MPAVGHRPELGAFHERKLVMQVKPGGAQGVKDIYLVSKTRDKRYRWRWLRRSARKLKPA
jgi:vitamin B12/bleomycin/antimicrobial peptide transport system ATP-binding/permease protein